MSAIETKSISNNFVSTGTSILQSPRPFTKVIRLTPAEWAEIPDNPRQRDTERRLKDATHLLNESPTHAIVSLAHCEATDQSWKLDGHTRDLLWQRQPNLAPKSLLVTVYFVQSEAEAAELYTHFDNPFATETPRDRLSGATREMGWKPNSNFFKNNNFNFAVAIAEGIVRGRSSELRLTGREPDASIYEILPNWAAELKALDELNPIGKRFKSIILAAALLTMRRRGIEKAKPFWEAYNADQGVKLESSFDGVEALSRLVSSTKNISHGNRHQLLSRAISCFESWRTKRDYKGGHNSSPKSTDLLKYMEPVISGRSEEN